jgi:hypothetical protein
VTIGIVELRMERPMLQNPALLATDSLIRAQLAMFQAQSDKVMLTSGDRHDALELDDRTWTAWTDFMADGKRPVAPPVPEMLRRLAEAAYYLSVIAEQAAEPG